MRCGGNCLHRILDWILFEMWRMYCPSHRILGRILFETRRELPPRTTGLVTIHNNFLANFLKRLFLPSPIFASFARDNIICTKTGINVKQSYLLTYSPRVNFISPAMFYFLPFCYIRYHGQSHQKSVRVAKDLPESRLKIFSQFLQDPS